MNSDPTEGTWHQRTVDLSSFAGKTVDKLWIAAGSGTPVGNWVILYGDISIVHPDGTVTTIYDRAKSESFSYWSGGGETNPQAWIEHKTTSGNQPAVTTSYYLADQIGSTRMVLSAGGWPVAGGTYYPFGVEIGSSASPNHYKFSGKDRDAASGLDDFGARYYSSVMGRFMTPDWSASPEPVPYAKLDNPQSLNLYSYVENNPLTGIDADGHCGNGLVGNELTPGGPKPKKDPCPSVAKTKVAAKQNGGAVLPPNPSGLGPGWKDVTPKGGKNPKIPKRYRGPKGTEIEFDPANPNKSPKTQGGRDHWHEIDPTTGDRKDGHLAPGSPMPGPDGGQTGHNNNTTPRWGDPARRIIEDIYRWTQNLPSTPQAHPPVLPLPPIWVFAF